MTSPESSSFKPWPLFFGIKNLVFKTLGVTLIIVSLYTTYLYSISPALFILLIALYLFGLVKYPHIWLIALPACLPAFDFGTWTGNILYNEFDAFALTTIGFLFYKKNITNRHKYRYEFYFLTLLLFTLGNIAIGLNTGIIETDVMASDIHQHALNSLRVGKGFLFAWFIWYFMREALNNHSQQTQKWIAIGLLSSLSVFSLLVFWERHILSSFLSFDLYGITGAILDFTNGYRITGFFSGMHVGGTAVDGYLIACLPSIFFINYTHNHSKSSWLCLMILILGIYCVIVTFTRMTIASFGISLLTSVILIAYKKSNPKNHQINLIKPFLIIVVVILLLTQTKSNCGYQALVVQAMIILASIFTLYHKNKINNITITLLLGLLLTTGIFGTIDSAVDSKWVSTTIKETSRLYAFIFTLLSLSIGAITGNYMAKAKIPLHAIKLPFIIIGTATFVMVGIQSSQMSERFSQVSDDFKTRWDHWQDITELRTPDSPIKSMFGEGSGTMAKRYYMNHFDKRDLPTFSWNEDEDRTYLTLGAGNYKFFQKMILHSQTGYTLSAYLKAQSLKDSLTIQFCRRHILVPLDAWQGDCPSVTFRPKTTEWEFFDWHFDSKTLGTITHQLNWPVAIEIINTGNNPINIDFIELSRNNTIQNNSFDDQLKSWFWAVDADHLPWHTKQLLLHIWLEQGWLGLILFFSLIGLGFHRQFDLMKRGKEIPIAFIPTLTGILCLGLTDTFIDEPQASFMVYCMLFACLQWPLAPNKTLV